MEGQGLYLGSGGKGQVAGRGGSRLAERVAVQAQLHAATAERVGRQIEQLVPATTATPYLQAKGLQPTSGILVDNAGKTTYIPAVDAEGKLWSMLYIQEDGTKRLAKDSRKKGCFPPVGGLNAVAKAPALHRFST